MSPAVFTAPMSTTELLRQTSELAGRRVSRDNIYRLRTQYGDRAPTPFRAGMNFAWDRSAPEIFANILKTEARCKAHAS